MNPLKPGAQALIVHARRPDMTGRTCVLNYKIENCQYDYASELGTFDAWNVTFNGAPIPDDRGNPLQRGAVPEIYLVPLDPPCDGQSCTESRNRPNKITLEKIED